MKVEQWLAILTGIIILGVLFLFQYILVLAINRYRRQRGDPSIGFWDLLVTWEDRKYSLSRVQMYLWTYTVITTFVAMCALKRGFIDVPASLVFLMGISLASTALSTAVTSAKGAQPADQPNFWVDIFCVSPSQGLDLARCQMAAWTLAIWVVYVVITVQNIVAPNIVASTLTLPDVPDALVALMGVSHATYLGLKLPKSKPFIHRITRQTTIPPVTAEIEGINFGTAPGNVEFGTQPSPTIQEWNDTIIIAVEPTGITRPIAIRAITADKETSNQVNYR